MSIEISAEFGTFDDFLVMLAFVESQECCLKISLNPLKFTLLKPKQQFQTLKIVLLLYLLASKLLKDNQPSIHPK
uniref:Uncharacterized protein n=1 Tax=Strongyloides papillosus TaxID=174720 RepID=A0A0N5B594_STREA